MCYEKYLLIEELEALYEVPDEFKDDRLRDEVIRLEKKLENLQNFQASPAENSRFCVTI